MLSGFLWNNYPVTDRKALLIFAKTNVFAGERFVLRLSKPQGSGAHQPKADVVVPVRRVVVVPIG